MKEPQYIRIQLILLNMVVKKNELEIKKLCHLIKVKCKKQLPTIT